MNLRIIPTLFFFFLLLPYLSSQVYYEPDEGSMLSLNTKQNLSISMSVGSSKENRFSYATKLGYSPIKHLALQGGFYKSNYIYPSDTRHTRFKAYDIAIGTYWFFTKGAKNNMDDIFSVEKGIITDFYLGYASGIIENQYDNSEYSDLDYQKLFAQLGVHVRRGMLGLQLAFKAGRVHFISGNYTNLENFDEEPVRSFTLVLEEESAHFLNTILQLNLNIRFGSIFFSQTLSSFDRKSRIEALDNTYRFGMRIDIDEFFKKRPKNIVN